MIRWIARISPAFIIKSISVSLLIAALVACEAGYRTGHQSVPDYCRRGHEFLEFIRSPAEPTEGYSPDRTPKWDTGKLMSYVSDDGIAFSDVNLDKPWHSGKAEVERQLRLRNGNAFLSLSHLSHIYSIPYKQYSELSCEKTQAGFTICVSSWYRLAFRGSGNGEMLVGIDYLQAEGD